jgi:hypothetical protein
MTETKVVRHSLTNRDQSTLTADCSVCGFVAIRKAGNGFQCAVKIAERHKAWTHANPDKASANRRLRSEHELFNRDYLALTAGCTACAREVDMVMYGAGYACGVRARELRSVQQQSTVGSRCRECTIVDGPANAPRLLADGTCPRCAEGPDRYDPSHVVPERRRKDHGVAAEYEFAGYHVVYEDDDAYQMPESESAVPGWKTLGSSRPWNEV